jgi:hypothetical protein
MSDPPQTNRDSEADGAPVSGSHWSQAALAQAGQSMDSREVGEVVQPCPRDQWTPLAIIGDEPDWSSEAAIEDDEDWSIEAELDEPEEWSSEATLEEEPEDS